MKTFVYDAICSNVSLVSCEKLNWYEHSWFFSLWELSVSSAIEYHLALRSVINWITNIRTRINQEIFVEIYATIEKYEYIFCIRCCQWCSFTCRSSTKTTDMSHEKSKIEMDGKKSRERRWRPACSTQWYRRNDIPCFIIGMKINVIISISIQIHQTKIEFDT